MKTIESLLSHMTLREKATICSGQDAWGTYPIEELDIPRILMSDGPHGLRKQYNEATAMPEQSRPATCFPAPSASACSFDRQLLYDIGKAIGEEARDQGVSLVLGPGVDIKRSPLCGRNFEYFSEDPYLSGQLGTAIIQGIQSTGTGACVKHFVANNREYFRMVTNSIVDERALHEIYLEPFAEIMENTQPYAVMCAYNQLNGEYCGEKTNLMDHTLRKEMGFNGVVISDWGAVHNREQGIACGLDLEMPYSGTENTERILSAIERDILTETQLDACVHRILELIQQCTEDKSKPFICDMQQHHELAFRAAVESSVLLKNDGTLPLSADKEIALIGEFIEKPRYQGTGSSTINPANLENTIEQFKKHHVPYRYARGYDLLFDHPDEALIDEAVALAKETGIAVIFAGLPTSWETEGVDRRNLDLPPAQNELIARVARVAKTVVVLCAGGAVEMPWLFGTEAVLHCYLGGEAMASAVVQLLYGMKNPCGKLAETYPFHGEDVPSFHFFNDDPHNAEYRESIYIGYRYYDAAEKAVCFPFGHGLSYTTFEYTGFSIKTDAAAANAIVSFKITNTGNRGGADVPQVYTRGLSQHHKQLFGFEKVFLKAGESKRVSIRLPERAFLYYHNGGWHRENCEILVGHSSRNILYAEKFELENSLPAPYYQVSFDGHWDSMIFYDLFNKIPQVFLIERPFTLNATLADIRTAPLGRLIIRGVLHFMERNLNPQNLELRRIIKQYVLENPFRALASLSGGLFSHAMARSVLAIANGHVVVGVARLLFGLKKLKKLKGPKKVKNNVYAK